MIIGLSGYAGSGKDTVADYLVNDKGFVRVAFADAIKEALRRLNPILENGFTLNENVLKYGWEVTKAKSETRRLMQVFGTEVGRNMFGSAFWVDFVFFKTIRNYPEDTNFVIPDVRFPNEADIIRERGGKVWRIERENIAPINSHSSETALDDYDFDLVLRNNHSLDTLYSMVDNEYQNV